MFLRGDPSVGALPGVQFNLVLPFVYIRYCCLSTNYYIHDIYWSYTPNSYSRFKSVSFSSFFFIFAFFLYDLRIKLVWWMINKQLNVLLSITVISGLLFSNFLFVWIAKSHKILHFSPTPILFRLHNCIMWLCDYYIPSLVFSQVPVKSIYKLVLPPFSYTTSGASLESC